MNNPPNTDDAPLVLEDGDRFHAIIASDDIRYGQHRDTKTVIVFFVVRRRSGTFEMVHILRTLKGGTCISRQVQRKGEITANRINREVKAIRTFFSEGIFKETGFRIQWDTLDLSTVSDRDEQMRRIKAWNRIGVLENGSFGLTAASGTSAKSAKPGDLDLPRTTITAPRWDAANPRASFVAFAGQIHEEAKKVLLRDGNHAEMFFFVSLKGVGHIVLWRSADRDLEAEWLRKHLNEHYVFGVIHVVEAWTHWPKTPDDHTLKQIQAGEIKVSELSAGEKGEALMVSAQSRDGWAMSWVDIMGRNGGRLTLGECRQFEDFRGRFGKLFG